MKTRYATILAAAVTLAVLGGGAEIGMPANPSVLNIQRTMKMLDESTAENPATVRVLFYGQSITAQGWTKILMANLTNRYPTVNFIYENRAIGGYESPTLIKTAESDLYPFYPDILFFHVYGPFDKYEEIVRRVRERTTAEIVLWTSHLKRKESPVEMLRSRDERSMRILGIAEKYGCLAVDLNRKWSEMMIGHGYTMDDLLIDGIHMKGKGPAWPAYAAFVGGELVRVPGTEGNPKFSGTVTKINLDDSSVKRGEDGSITLSFTGNRVVAVSDGTGSEGATAKLLLDGRPVDSYPEMYANTRPSAIVTWMPMINLVTRKAGAMPVAEDWTLTYTEGTQPDGQKIHYRLDGSVTGFDGEGWNTETFVSKSGRAVIEPADFHIWQYKYVKDKKHYIDRGLDKAKVGDKVEWKTVKMFADPYEASPARTQTVLVQNCANGPHTLTIIPQGGTVGIGSFIVNTPAKLGEELVVSPDGTSIENVLEKIREARQAGDNSLKRVAVRGCNQLNETVRLSAADFNISFEGESGASLFGGVEIDGWKVGADGIWRVELPEVKEGKWNFSTIYVNGERRSRPTIPAAGYYESVSNAFVVEGVSTGGFVFKPGELPATLENISDVEVFALHNWATTRARIGELDAKNGLLRFASQRERERSSFDFVRRRYRLENVKEAFTEAGTWYLDRLSGVLSYRPLPGETPANAKVVAPRLETLVRIDGAIGVKFENVVFAYQNLVTPETGRFAIQGGWNVPAAVEVAASKDVSFVRCGFTHTDGYAVDVAWNCEGTVVSYSLLCDLGAGGVRIGNFDRSKILEMGGKRGTIVGNCRITDCGHVFPEGVGVFIGRSSYNTVVSNEIDHLRYSGVSVGWDWDDKRPSKAHHNEIAYNHIHDIGLGLLSDMGMIYLLGRAPGTTVHDNNLHDVSCFTYGGNGIYPDEGSSELKIWNNVVRNAKAKCYHQNYGEENEVFNNIFVNSKLMQWDCKPPKGSAVDSVNMHHNTFVWKEGKFFERSWPFALHMTAKEREDWMAETPVWQGFSSDSNILWRIDGKEPDFCGMPYSEWVKKSGHERGSFVGNPGFLGDVFSGDCSLAPDSPAVRLGFKPVAPVDYTGRSYMISWQNNKEGE